MSTEPVDDATVDDNTVQTWIDADPDPVSRAELAALDADEIAERFSDTLHFGTAGLRGPVRAGPNGMNVAVVTRTTHAIADWLERGAEAGATVVVGRDARHGSEAFAAATTGVLAARGFDVVALPDPAPTPLVAFACRDLGASLGIQITASHNPPADNGYKVYVSGGAQLIPPDDAEIEALIATAPAAADIPRVDVVPDDRARRNTDRYLARLAHRFGTVESATSIRIALTAMHGVGGRLASEALRQAGFDDLHVVDQQFEPDPDFPTVQFPNPEEPGAADLLLGLAADINADLAIALDPDADRCAVGIRDTAGWRMLTGDETGALFAAHLLEANAASATALIAPVVASTIVSGSLAGRIAESAGARSVRTLTGFKWLVRAGEPLLYAYEEAIGHCVDPDAVRDKDGISAAVVAAQLAHRRKSAGSDLRGALDDLQATFGVHVTAQRSVRVTDLAEITMIMRGLRADPPQRLCDIEIRADDQSARTDHLATDAVIMSGTAADGTTIRVVARPSGTEPKLKYYVEAVALPDTGELGDVRTRLGSLVASILDELPGAT